MRIEEIRTGLPPHIGANTTWITLGRLLSVAGHNFSVQKILSLGCGSRKYRNGGYGDTYEPHGCRYLHTLHDQGLSIIGVDSGDLSGEKFPYHNFDLTQEKRRSRLVTMYRDSVDVVLDTNFTAELNTCPNLQCTLQKEGIDIRVFQQHVANMAKNVLRNGGYYCIYGGGGKSYKKVGQELELVDSWD